MADLILTVSSKHGFSLDSLIAQSYIQHRIYRKGEGTKPIRLSTSELEGILTIHDPARSRSLLFSSIGPAKAFGCRLMLVKRI